MRYIVRRVTIPKQASKDKRPYVLFNDADYIYMCDHFYIYVESITEDGKEEIIFKNPIPLRNFILYDVFKNEELVAGHLDTNVYLQYDNSWKKEETKNFKCVIIALDFGQDTESTLYINPPLLSDRSRKDFDIDFSHNPPDTDNKKLMSYIRADLETLQRTTNEEPEIKEESIVPIKAERKSKIYPVIHEEENPTPSAPAPSFSETMVGEIRNLIK